MSAVDTDADQVDPSSGVGSLEKVNEQLVRTDPISSLVARKRRLDRQAALGMPEIHYLGEFRGGENIVSDITEGAFCR